MGAKIIVQSARVDTDRKMSDDATGVAVVVSVRIKNTSNRSLLVSPYDFDLYDEKEGLYILDDSTFDNNQIGTNLAPGKEVQLDSFLTVKEVISDPIVRLHEQTKWLNGKLKIMLRTDSIFEEEMAQDTLIKKCTWNFLYVLVLGQFFISATAVKSTSVEELRAVSQESWMTPMTKSQR